MKHLESNINWLKKTCFSWSACNWSTLFFAYMDKQKIRLTWKMVCKYGAVGIYSYCPFTTTPWWLFYSWVVLFFWARDQTDTMSATCRYDVREKIKQNGKILDHIASKSKYKSLLPQLYKFWIEIIVIVTNKPRWKPTNNLLLPQQPWSFTDTLAFDVCLSWNFFWFSLHISLSLSSPQQVSRKNR